MTCRNGAKASGDWSGFPVFGSRAWTCTKAAPASAAPIAASAISSAVIGKYGDIEGVWIAPVTAHVMMTLRFLAMACCSGSGGGDRPLWGGACHPSMTAKAEQGGG